MIALECLNAGYLNLGRLFVSNMALAVCERLGAHFIRLLFPNDYQVQNIV